MMENKDIIAQKVRATRLAKGYTQLELSERTNVSLRSIQRIENGEVMARAYTLKLLAGELGFDISTAILTPEQLPVRNSNTASKIILSTGSALVMLLLGGAFLSQSTHFPETAFEAFLFWALVAALYFALLVKIWK